MFFCSRFQSLIYQSESLVFFVGVEPLYNSYTAITVSSVIGIQTEQEIVFVRTRNSWIRERVSVHVDGFSSSYKYPGMHSLFSLTLGLRRERQQHYVIACPIDLDDREQDGEEEDDAELTLLLEVRGRRGGRGVGVEGGGRSSSRRSRRRAAGGSDGSSRS